jgi:hypothetical protein
MRKTSPAKSAAKRSIKPAAKRSIKPAAKRVVPKKVPARKSASPQKASERDSLAAAIAELKAITRYLRETVDDLRYLLEEGEEESPEEIAGVVITETAEGSDEEEV